MHNGFMQSRQFRTAFLTRYLIAVPIVFLAADFAVPFSRRPLLWILAAALALMGTAHAVAFRTGRWREALYFALAVDTVTAGLAVFYTGMLASPFLIVTVMPFAMTYFTGHSVRALAVHGALTVAWLAFLMGLWWHQGPLVAGWDGRDFPAYAALVGLVQLLAVAGLAAQAIDLPRPLVAEVAEQAALIERQGHRAELGTSLAMMAHEIRTPLTTVGFGLHAALDQLKAPEGPGSTRALRHLQSADQELDRLNRMLEGLLSYARDRRGRMQLKPHRPIALFNRAVEFARLKWARSQRSFETRAATETPRGVRCDVDAMHQVLVNLLDHAIMRREPGKPLKIDLNAREERGRVALIVADTGAVGGIPDAGSAGARPEADRGHRVGIAIAKRLVEEQGGRFAIESTPGGGTTCTVWLPSVEIAPPDAEAA